MSEHFLLSLPWNEDDLPDVSALVQQRRKTSYRLCLVFLVLCGVAYSTPTEEVLQDAEEKTSASATATIAPSKNNENEDAVEETAVSIIFWINVCILAVGMLAIFILLYELKRIERALEVFMEVSFGLSQVAEQEARSRRTARTPTRSNRPALLASVEPFLTRGLDFGGSAAPLAYSTLRLDWTRIQSLRAQRRSRGAAAGDSSGEEHRSSGLSRSAKDKWLRFVVVAHCKKKTANSIKASDRGFRAEDSTPLLLPSQGSELAQALTTSPSRSGNTGPKSTRHGYGSTTRIIINVNDKQRGLSELEDPLTPKHEPKSKYIRLILQPRDRKTLDQTTYDRHAHIPIDAPCSICLSPYQPGDNAVRLSPCDHVYHETCIEVWVRCNVRCPLCNQSLEKVLDENC